MNNMGRGNWTPNTPARDYNADTFRNQVYVDLSSPEEDYDSTGAYDELKDCLENALSDTYDKLNRLERHRWFSGGYHQDTEALFYNQHVLVVWDTHGERFHQGVGVVVNPDAYRDGVGGLAELTAQRTFDRIVKALCEVYGRNVSYRTSAWTSTPVIPTTLAQWVA